MVDRRTRGLLGLLALLLATSLACNCDVCGLSPPSVPETPPPAPTQAGEAVQPTAPDELDWYLPLMAGPGIARAEGRFDLFAEGRVASPRFSFPVPLDFEDQVPLTFSLVVAPADMLVGAQWVQRNAHDWVLEVTLQPMQEGDTVEVAWESCVLIRGHDYSGLPTSAPVPDAVALPPDVAQWLRATACVQADHLDVQAAAAGLHGDGDLLGIARRVVDFTLHCPLGDFDTLDAVEALHNGGSCTSMANLAAALLRANGIPARVLALYPTDGQWYDTHYITEFYVPEYGWVWMESTVGQIPWLPRGGVVVAVAYPEDEDRAFDSFRWVMPGVPWGSLTENLVGDYGLLYQGGGEDHGDHAGSAVRVFADTGRLEEAFALAERVWQADLALRTMGREDTGAQAHQQAAAQSETLDEVIAHLQEAEQLYSTD